MGPGGSVVGLTFDATTAWPVYDWMGVAKAALESTSRYLARDLGPEGIRCNLVSAGPLKTLAAKAIPGFEDLEAMWETKAPLGWDNADHEPTAKAVVRAAVRLLPRHHGRDRPRRRRLPRHGGVSARDLLVSGSGWRPGEVLGSRRRGRRGRAARRPGRQGLAPAGDRAGAGRRGRPRRVRRRPGCRSRRRRCSRCSTPADRRHDRHDRDAAARRPARAGVRRPRRPAAGRRRPPRRLPGDRARRARVGRRRPRRWPGCRCCRARARSTRVSPFTDSLAALVERRAALARGPLLARLPDLDDVVAAHRPRAGRPARRTAACRCTATWCR